MKSRRAVLFPALICCALSLIFLPPTAHGAYWTSPPDDIDPQTANDDWGPRLTIDLSGTVWVAWMGIDPVEGDEEVLFARWSGSSWTSGALVNPPNQLSDRFPEIESARDGTVWCLWAGVTPTGEYVGLTSRWMVSSWSLPDTVWKAGSRYDQYGLTPLNSSEAWISRSGIVGSTYDVHLYHLNGSVVQIFNFPDPVDNEYYPTVSIAGDGTPWAAWSQVPPTSPNQALLHFTRFVNGSWEPPQPILQPLGMLRPYIHIGPDDSKWIICDGIDPVNGYRNQAIWGVRWEGQSWSTPVRISEPVTSNDTTQVWLSVSRNPTAYPRAVWVRHNIFSTTRFDPLTSAWDGTQWSRPELAGALTDSAYIAHPDIAVAGDYTVWVAYMKRALPDPTWHVYSTHRVEEPTAITGMDFEAVPIEDSVEITWHLPRSGADQLRIFRAPGRARNEEKAPPVGSDMILEKDGVLESAGRFVDRPSRDQDHEFSYWLEARLPGGDSWAGPKTVRLRSSPVGGLVSATPNPSDGSVALRGRLAHASDTVLLIFDLGGRLIRSLRPPLVGTAGSFSIVWDGRIADGRPAPSGVYLARLLGHGGQSAGQLRIVLVR